MIQIKMVSVSIYALWNIIEFIKPNTTVRFSISKKSVKSLKIM